MTICCHEQQPPRQTAKPRMRAPRAPAHVTVRRAWGERLCVLFTYTHTLPHTPHQTRPLHTWPFLTPCWRKRTWDVPPTLGRFAPLRQPCPLALLPFAHTWPFDTALGHCPWTLGALEKTHRLVCLFSIAHLPLAPSSLFALFAPGPFALWPLCPWPLWPWIEHSPVYQRTSLCAAHVERAPLRPSTPQTAHTPHTTTFFALCLNAL